MLVYDLFRPAAYDGAILRLKHSGTAAYRPFQWNPQSRFGVRSDIAIESPTPWRMENFSKRLWRESRLRKLHWSPDPS